MTTTTETNLLEIILDRDPEWGEAEVVYEFNNKKRKFYSTDRSEAGVYKQYVLEETGDEFVTEVEEDFIEMETG